MTYQRDPDPMNTNRRRMGRTDDGSYSLLSGLVGVLVVIGLIALGYSLLNSGPEGRRSSTAEAPVRTTPAAPTPTPATPPPAPQTK